MERILDSPPLARVRVKSQDGERGRRGERKEIRPSGGSHTSDNSMWEVDSENGSRLVPKPLRAGQGTNFVRFQELRDQTNMKKKR